MTIAASVVVALVALLHSFILYLEAFAWTSERALRALGNSLEQAEATRKLAANMGLYNGFLAAGLFWGLYLVWTGAGYGAAVESFFLGCVWVAGVVGAITVSARILLIQTVPASVGLVLVWLAGAA